MSVAGNISDSMVSMNGTTSTPPNADAATDITRTTHNIAFTERRTLLQSA